MKIFFLASKLNKKSLLSSSYGVCYLCECQVGLFVNENLNPLEMGF